MRQNPTSNIVPGLALKPQNINSSAINGATITRPWQTGRKLFFTLVAAAMAATDALTISVQLQKISDDSWVGMKEADGTTALTFTVSKSSDAAELENGFLFGSIDLTRIDTATYKAVRLSAINAVAQNVILGAGYGITDLYEEPGTGTDDLLSKQLPA